jgi:hypothetical protein
MPISPRRGLKCFFRSIVRMDLLWPLKFAEEEAVSWEKSRLSGKMHPVMGSRAMSARMRENVFIDGSFDSSIGYATDVKSKRPGVRQVGFHDYWEKSFASRFVPFATVTIFSATRCSSVQFARTEAL